MFRRPRQPLAPDRASSCPTPRGPAAPRSFLPEAAESCKTHYRLDLTLNFSSWDQSAPSTLGIRRCSSQRLGLQVLSPPPRPVGSGFFRGRQLRSLGSSSRHTVALRLATPGPRDGADAALCASCTLSHYMLLAALSCSCFIERLCCTRPGAGWQENKTN